MEGEIEIVYVDSKYLEFVLRERKPKTSVIEIISKTSGYGLGIIKYYGGWRQYCFFPHEGTRWNAVCLNDLQQFILAMNSEQKAKKGGVK